MVKNNKKQTADIILAYMRSGKTEAEARYKNVSDIDIALYLFKIKQEYASLPFEKRKGRTDMREKDPEYPHNFLNAVKDELVKDKIVMVPYTPVTYKLFTEEQGKDIIEDNNVKLTIAFPQPADIAASEERFREYARRFTERGNPQEFVERRMVEFPKLAETFAMDTAADKKINLRRGQFLSDALIEEGFNLEKKGKLTTVKEEAIMRFKRFYQKYLP